VDEQRQYRADTELTRDDQHIHCVDNESGFRPVDCIHGLIRQCIEGTGYCEYDGDIVLRRPYHILDPH